MKRCRMTIDDFKAIGEQHQVQLIFDAVKISEKVDNENNYQLFQIENFFVETKTSLEGKFKRCIKAYTLKELPIEYAGEVLGLPIVTLENNVSATQEANSQNLYPKRKKSFFN